MGHGVLLKLRLGVRHHLRSASEEMKRQDDVETREMGVDAHRAEVRLLRPLAGDSSAASVSNLLRLAARAASRRNRATMTRAAFSQAGICTRARRAARPDPQTDPTHLLHRPARRLCQTLWIGGKKKPHSRPRPPAGRRKNLV